MSADEVVRAIESLQVRLDDLRADVGSTKARVVNTHRQVGSLVAGANGQGTIASLRSSCDEFKKAVDHVDVAHDSLKAALDSIQRYTAARFTRSGGGGAGASGPWQAEGPALGHVTSFDRAQRRAMVKKALLVGTTGAVAATGLGALAGALVIGAPLAAVLTAGVVSNGTAFLISRARDVLEFEELRASGAPRSELRAKVKSIAIGTGADAAGNWLLPPLGVYNNVSAVAEVFRLAKM